MSSSSWHVALFNIARAISPLDDPILADFMGNLDRINGLADGNEGLVWRFQTASGNATDERPMLTTESSSTSPFGAMSNPSEHSPTAAITSKLCVDAVSGSNG